VQTQVNDLLYRGEFSFGHLAGRAVGVKETPRAVRYDFEFVLRAGVGPLDRHATGPPRTGVNVRRRSVAAERRQQLDELFRQLEDFRARRIGVVAVPVRSEVGHCVELFQGIATLTPRPGSGPL
jgi:hypothetical protein